MKKLVFVLLASFSTVFSFSQDVITKSNGEEIKAKVIEVTQTELKYKKFDNLNGPTFSIPKSDVFMLRYENGSKDVFNTDRDSKSGNGDINVDASEKGKRDAKLNYRGQNSGATWTGATAALISPLFGLIPAIITTSAEPKEENLGIPDQKLFKDSNYKSGYVEEAHKKKKSKVWKSFGIGSGIWIGLILLLGV